MSVIVWDGVTLAADTDASDGQVKFIVAKVWRHGDALYGGVGPLIQVAKVAQWIDKGMVVSEYPLVSDSLNFVRVTRDKGLLRWTHGAIPIQHGFNKCAFGTGRDFAYGALHVGADSLLAVEAAITYCATCSGKAIGVSL